jgi:hypothetical protein
MREDLKAVLPVLLAMPRPRKGRFKAELREILLEPIRAYGNRVESMETPEGRQAIAQARLDREECLFALFDISNDWPEDLQWRELALSLAGELFPGCRTWEKGRGGPSEDRRKRIAALKEDIFTRFEAVKHKRRCSDFSIAEIFLKSTSQHLADCNAAGFSDAKSLAQAMQTIRKKRHQNWPPIGTTAR